MSKRAKPRPTRANGKAKPSVQRPQAKPGTAAPVVVYPVAAPPPPGPAPEAVAKYEAGIAAFQKQNYNEAAETFRQLLSAFPREGSLADRARHLRARSRRPAFGSADRRGAADGRNRGAQRRRFRASAGVGPGRPGFRSPTGSGALPAGGGCQPPGPA